MTIITEAQSNTVTHILMGTVSAAIFGRLADIYGKKRIFVLLAGIYTLATYLCPILTLQFN